MNQPSRREAPARGRAAKLMWVFACVVALVAAPILLLSKAWHDAEWLLERMDRKPVPLELSSIDFNRHDLIAFHFQNTEPKTVEVMGQRIPVLSGTSVTWSLSYWGVTGITSD